MIRGIAHSAVCVPDVDAATAWYSEVLGFTVLSPPYLMEGDAIAADMGELIPSPRLKASIVGVPGDGDRVLELIEYPDTPGRPRSADPTQAGPELTAWGLSHVGLVCDDIEETRAALEAEGVTFLTRGIASIARLRTTWFIDPFGVVFILLEKSDDAKPYFAQH